MNHWMTWALMAAFFAGLTAIFAKLGVENVNSNVATAIRTVIILILSLLIAIPALRENGLAGISRRTWLFLVLSGLATGLSWLCYFRALQMGPASQVAPLDKLSVVFVLLLAALFLGEPMNARLCIGAALMVGGAIVVATAQT